METVFAARQFALVMSLYRIVTVMSLLQNTVHHLAGHAFALYQLVRVEGLTPVAAASIIALDQVAEGFAKVGLLAPLAFFVAIPGPLGLTAGGLAAGALLLYAALWLAAGARGAACARAGHAADDDPRWLRLVTSWGGQLADMLNPRRMVVATLLACSKKLLRAAAVWCVQESLGLALPWYVPLVVVGAVDVATLIPVVPGHLGVYEAAICLVYSRQNVEPERALLAALLFHGVSLYATIIPGLVVLGWKTLYQPGQVLHIPSQSELDSQLSELRAGASRTVVQLSARRL